jgi:hypothetical protein
MEVITLEATESTPKILFDHQTGELRLSGRSIPENATRFYYPLLDWLNEYAESPAEQTKFEFYLEYINSISQKMVLEILNIAQRMRQNSKSISIVWRYDEDDDEMLEEAQVFAQKFELEIQIIPVPEDEQ